MELKRPHAPLAMPDEQTIPYYARPLQGFPLKWEMEVCFVCLFVQWDTVDLPPPPPEIKEKRKADRRLVQVHQTNSRAQEFEIPISTLPVNLY